MKGKENVIEKLNDLLADELTGINQYMVHAEMCDDWMYERLHKRIEKRAMDEMRHAQKLIARILFLEGRPIVSELKDLHIGAEVGAQLQNDWKIEADAIASYNDGIRLCMEMGDSGTRELLEHILEDEEKHIDWIEAQKDQIEHIGMKVYLNEQIDE